jgi:hypothetical protein
MGVFRDFVKPQNMGSPPTHTIDAALRKGAWPRNELAQLLYRRENRIIIPQAKLNYTVS